MDTYAYKGISDGKYVEGDIEALNQDEASHKLKEQKIIITNLVRAVKGKKKEDKETKKKKGSSLFGKKKAKVEDVLIFSKQFATMVKAGLPILQVLGMLRDQLESPAMKDVVLGRQASKRRTRINKRGNRYGHTFSSKFHH